LKLVDADCTSARQVLVVSESKRWLLDLYFGSRKIDSACSCVLSANPLNVLLEGAVVGKSFHADAITFDFAFFLETIEVRHNVVSETVLSGEKNDLTASKLETSSVKGFLGVVDELWLGSN
jgi:hypothetical protein